MGRELIFLYKSIFLLKTLPEIKLQYTIAVIFESCQIRYLTIYANHMMCIFFYRFLKLKCVFLLKTQCLLFCEIVIFFSENCIFAILVLFQAATEL